MTRPIRECLLFLTSPTIVLCAQSETTGLRIHIHLYNYAALSRETLAQAEHEAARIFRRMDIETEWLDCPLNEEQLSRNRASMVRARRQDLPSVYSPTPWRTVSHWGMIFSASPYYPSAEVASA
jgi:hypothetical protein